MTLTHPTCPHCGKPPTGVPCCERAEQDGSRLARLLGTGLTEPAPLTVQMLEDAFAAIQAEDHERDRASGEAVAAFWARIPESARGDIFLAHVARALAAGAIFHPADAAAIQRHVDEIIDAHQ